MINLHILGVQKAGTTALASFLQQHPDIYVVNGKEAHVFDHPTFSQQANKKRIARLKYRELLTQYKGEKIICDATPITLYRDEFLKECIAYNTKAKFIVVLRDPVERAVSHYHMSRQKGAESRCLLLAFILEHWRLKPHKNANTWPFDSSLRQHSYLSRGRYKSQLTRLYRYVKQSQVLVVQQSQLKSQHQNTLKRVFSFLDLPDEAIPAKTVFTTPPSDAHWSDSLAKIYAKLYFAILS